MSACQRLLDTYELLENIILQLPAIEIRKAQKLSKTWFQLIHGSKQIQERLKPLAPLVDTECVEKDILMYDANLRLHPLLMTSYQRGTWNIRYADCFKLLERKMDEYRDNAVAFATSPPCQVICIDATQYGKYEESPQTFGLALYVKEGIRMSHLLEVYEKLLRQQHALRTNKKHRTVVYGIIRGKEDGGAKAFL